MGVCREPHRGGGVTGTLLPPAFSLDCSMRWLGVGRFDPVKFESIHGGGNPLQLETQPGQLPPLSHNHFVQLVDMLFQVGKVGFEPFELGLEGSVHAIYGKAFSRLGRREASAEFRAEEAKPRDLGGRSAPEDPLPHAFMLAKLLADVNFRGVW